MLQSQKEAILISFLSRKEKYRRLAEYIIHLIRDDPSSPKDSLHAIIYRIKDESRLIEKIDRQNKQLQSGAVPIDEGNFHSRVADLLGIRIVCLRLSDIKKVEAYLGLLHDEKVLRFLKGPVQKRSFILPIDAGESLPHGLDLTFSGYSSTHYQVELGDHLYAPAGIEKLRFEIQLRTILEEAWGEIDHKYRYARSRSDPDLPEYIHAGFYNFSAYLQVAAIQAEYLCRLVEDHRLQHAIHVKGAPSVPFIDASASPEIDTRGGHQKTLMLDARLEEFFGFKVNARTLTYIERRLNEVDPAEDPDSVLQRVFTQDRIDEFRSIFRETLTSTPFAKEKERNVDVVNAVNYIIFDELQGKRVAQEGLRSVLRWRKERSTC